MPVEFKAGLTAPARLDPDEADLFLKSVESTTKAGNLQAAIVLVYRRIGDLLANGQTEECNELLARVNVHTTDLDVLLAFLMATVMEREKLSARSPLYAATRSRFLRELGETETKKVFDNLA